MCYIVRKLVNASVYRGQTRGLALFRARMFQDLLSGSRTGWVGFLLNSAYPERTFSTVLPTIAMLSAIKYNNSVLVDNSSLAPSQFKVECL